MGKLLANSGIPKTGQTIMYQAGDDGNLQEGYPLTVTTTRWVDNGDGTVSDTMAGLMWVKNPELIIPTNAISVPASPTWATGQSYSIGDVLYVNQDNSSWFSGGSYYPSQGSYSRFRCITAHTSGSFQTDYNSGNWVFEAYGNDANQARAMRGQWTNNPSACNYGEYYPGDVIYDNNGTLCTAWVCIKAHTPASPACFVPGNIYAQGDYVWDGTTCAAPTYVRTSYDPGSPSLGFTDYTDTTSYNQGQVVYDNGSTNLYYYCQNSHTANGANVAADEANNPLSWTRLNSSTAAGILDIELQTYPNFQYWTQVSYGQNFQYYYGATFSQYWIPSVWQNSCSYLQDQQVCSWSDAVMNCNSLEYAGYKDWRMPNINELFSIMDFGVVNMGGCGPWVPTIFQNCSGCGTWTSTTVLSNTSCAFMINMYNNGFAINTQGKYSDQSYRPVRSI